MDCGIIIPVFTQLPRTADCLDSLCRDGVADFAFAVVNNGPTDGARDAGFRLDICGRAFIHHFGSVPQKSFKASMNKPDASLGDRAYYRKKYRLHWFWRLQLRRQEKLLTTTWRVREHWRYGCTLVSQRKDGRFVWR